jgi:hypothetical protein
VEQSGVLVGPITRRSRGSNPALAIIFCWDLNNSLFEISKDSHPRIKRKEERKKEVKMKRKEILKGMIL